MRRAFSFVLVALFATPPLAAGSRAEISGFPALASGLIRPKQQVPDDPLAGLPTASDGDRQGKGSGKGARVCRISAAPADPRDIGDLRATLAFVKRGPATWPCPSREADGIRLRIAVDGSGRITAVEPTGGDANTAAALAKKLTGQAIAPRPAGPTLGTTVLSFAGRKR